MDHSKYYILKNKVVTKIKFFTVTLKSIAFLLESLILTKTITDEN